jgi:hypothetical protein
MRIILCLIFLFFSSCFNEQEKELNRQKEVIDSIENEINRLKKEIEKEHKEKYKIIISSDSISNK